MTAPPAWSRPPRRHPELGRPTRRDPNLRNLAAACFGAALLLLAAALSGWVLP